MAFQITGVSTPLFAQLMLQAQIKETSKLRVTVTGEFPA